MFRRSSQIGLVLTFLVWPCASGLSKAERLNTADQAPREAVEEPGSALDDFAQFALFVGVLCLGLGALDHVGKDPKPLMGQQPKQPPEAS